MKMNKAKTRNHQNQGDVEDSEDSVIDLALLRRPISTSITGLEEVLRAYNDGTNELKKLLSKECDLIYECKVCRNIFRSLTNFISHKRVYCRNSFNMSDHFHFRNNGFTVQDISTIILAEQKISNNSSGIAGVFPGSDDKSKDLSSVVEHILWKQHQSRTSNVADVYDQINTPNRTTSQNEEILSAQQKNHTLTLNPVNDSDIAVYQSLQTDNENSNMKNEINEVHNMHSKKSNIVLGPDGKVLNLFNAHTNQKDAPENAKNSLICKVCNLQFETEKTLKLHLEMKHLPSAYVYQCPSCPSKFSSSGAVLKHLSNDHKKSNRRIRLMRDNIIKKRIRADEVSTKTSNTSRELQQLQISNGSDANKNSNSEWSGHDLKHENGISDDSHTCPSCLKKFDRKAVYTSHVQMCSDIKDREQERLKKRKAKDGAKIKQLLGSSLESEDNSNISEQRSNLNETDNIMKKCKRKNISKVKNDIEENKVVMPEEDSEDVVDWNLDDEEENKKLENIKKEIIEDDYKRVLEANIPNSLIKQEVNNESSSHDDEDDSGLIIDEKIDPEVSSFKCPTCNKIFATDEKLKYHLTFYHSRQKRFKCKMCEYQGYRKKDTMNHINFVHNSNVTLETLVNYTETVSKAVNEEDIKIQNELKKNQLKIKRKMARERQRKKASGENIMNVVEPEIKIEKDCTEEKQDTVASENESPRKIPKSRRKSSHTTSESVSIKAEQIEIVENKISDEVNNDLNKQLEVEDDYNLPLQQQESSSIRSSQSSSFSSISQYGKVVKNIPAMDLLDPKDPSHSRPIRNRIKPVRKDFLYDLSDLLKKEADCYREQSFQSSNVTVKRELRKRAMSTHTRETPSINTFDQSPKKQTSDSLIQPLGPPPIPNNTEEASKFKDQKNRRMSVLPTLTTRSIFPSQPRSPPYRPPATHKNAGSAYKMALKEFDNNRVSLYEPKFLWTICFEQENNEKIPSIASPAIPNSTNVSAAASILQRLSAKGATDSKATVTNDSTVNPLTAEQLCKKFELINVTNINEFDIPESNAINLNPGTTANNLMSLSLDETENDICVLQECSSDDDDDSEPKLEIEDRGSTSKRSRRSSSKRQSEKRKSSANIQRRLTVMQRLQENKIRKSREQLFQRFINQQNDNVDSPSSEFDLFSET